MVSRRRSNSSLPPAGRNWLECRKYCNFFGAFSKTAPCTDRHTQPATATGEAGGTRSRKRKANESNSNVSISIDQNSLSDERTLEDFKNGESFYRELCEEKDEKIRALTKEVEDKTAVIDRLRAELVRGLESAAVQNVAPDLKSDVDAGETNVMTVPAKKGANKKRAGSSKKRVGSNNMAAEQHLDSEKQARYRAKLEVRWNERIRQLEEYKQR